MDVFQLCHSIEHAVPGLASFGPSSDNDTTTISIDLTIEPRITGEKGTLPRRSWHDIKTAFSKADVPVKIAARVKARSVFSFGDSLYTETRSLRNDAGTLRAIAEIIHDVQSRSIWQHLVLSAKEGPGGIPAPFACVLACSIAILALAFYLCWN